MIFLEYFFRSIFLMSLHVHLDPSHLSYWKASEFCTWLLFLFSTSSGRYLTSSILQSLFITGLFNASFVAKKEITPVQYHASEEMHKIFITYIHNFIAYLVVQ